MKDWAKKFYNSSSWRKCRTSYIAARIAVDGGLCEICKEQQGYIVHHKEQLTKDNIYDADVTPRHGNLQYVCKECHDVIDGHLNPNSKKAPTCSFDEMGQPLPVAVLCVSRREERHEFI